MTGIAAEATSFVAFMKGMWSVSEFKPQPQHVDPLADARAWLAHMEQTLVRLAEKCARETEDDRLRETVTTMPLKKHDQHEHDQQFEGRRRSAEHLV